MFDNAVPLIWRRDTLYNGVQFRVGHLVPDSISSAKRKALWNSKRVELAPPGIDRDMLVPAARPVGFPDPVIDGNDRYNLDDLIADAIELVGITNADWNRSSNENQVELVAEVLALKLPELEETDGDPDSKSDEKPEEDTSDKGDESETSDEKTEEGVSTEVKLDAEVVGSPEEVAEKVKEGSSKEDSTDEARSAEESENTDTPKEEPAKVE